MTTLPNTSTTFTSTQSLNLLLSETLNQTKHDLQQLTQLTKKKLGKKALLFQQQQQMVLEDFGGDSHLNSSDSSWARRGATSSSLSGHHSNASATRRQNHSMNRTSSHKSMTSPSASTASLRRSYNRRPRRTSSRRLSISSDSSDIQPASGIDKDRTSSSASGRSSVRKNRRAVLMDSDDEDADMMRRSRYRSRNLGSAAGDNEADDLYVPSSANRDLDSADGRGMRRTTHLGKRKDITSSGAALSGSRVHDHSRLPDFIVPPASEHTHGSSKAQRDYELLNQLIETLKEKEKQKKKRGYTMSQFAEVYDRTKLLLEELWEEMHIPSDERLTFGRIAFNTKTIRNCVLIFDEISRLCRIRSIQHSVITKIEQREVFIRRLKHLDLRARNGTVPDNLGEILSLVRSLRITTMELVELIQQWRDSLKTPRIFYWKDENYLIKMRTDANFLQVSSFAPLFPFSVENNPLLLPNNLRCESARRRIYSRGGALLGIKTKRSDMTPKTPIDIISPFSPGFLSPTKTPGSIMGVQQPLSARHRSHSEAMTETSFVEESKHTSTHTVMTVIDNLSKEELERFQNAEQKLEAEPEYMKEILWHQKRNRAAAKIQTVVRALLARKVAHQRRKEKRVQERHRKRVLARMEEEQQQRKEESRLQKRHSISQLISQMDEDSFFNIPSSVVQKIPLGDEEAEVNFEVDDELFGDPFLTKYHRNGRYKAKLSIGNTENGR